MPFQSCCHNHLTNEILQTLEKLNKAEPRKYKNTSTEDKARRLSNWCLILAILLFLIALAFTLFYRAEQPAPAAKFFLLTIMTTVISMALLAIIIPPAASLATLVNWKKSSFTNLQDDIHHEYEIAENFKHHTDRSISGARFWLERKILRMRSRTTRFFGRETAVIGLVSAAMTFNEKLDLIQLLSGLFTGKISLANVGSVAVIFSAAFLVGISSGTMLLNAVISRYQYQIEILDLVEELKQRKQSDSQNEYPECESE
ncbi:hypothetical protein [Halopseudomonas xiamenensis]|uniref:hypothetical protein n=1 Tax=Halopseudomonas xiamenensis TaxID=157792 RepID=UPI00162892BE|nr:hypothetical protein [Halopseudomonas xiamenensis]